MAKDKSESKTRVDSKVSDDGKKNTSLRLGKKTLKSLKIRAIEEDTSVQKIIERLVEEYISLPAKKNE